MPKYKNTIEKEPEIDDILDGIIAAYVYCRLMTPEEIKETVKELKKIATLQEEDNAPNGL